MDGTPKGASLEPRAGRRARTPDHQAAARTRAHRRRDSIPKILDALYEKAKHGDVPAARELRGWYDQGLGKPGEAGLDTGDESRPYADMTPEERARIRARVIREIAEREAAEQVDAVDADPDARPPTPFLA
jgi:hypothetical protein